MDDWKGNKRGCVYLGVVTGKEFEQAYRDISESDTMLPIASTIQPVMDSQGCSNRDEQDNCLFNAWVFFEEKPVKRPGVKIEL